MDFRPPSIDQGVDRAPLGGRPRRLHLLRAARRRRQRRHGDRPDARLLRGHLAVRPAARRRGAPTAPAPRDPLGCAPLAGAQRGEREHQLRASTPRRALPRVDRGPRRRRIEAAAMRLDERERVAVPVPRAYVHPARLSEPRSRAHDPSRQGFVEPPPVRRAPDRSIPGAREVAPLRPRRARPPPARPRRAAWQPPRSARPPQPRPRPRPGRCRTSARARGRSRTRARRARARAHGSAIRSPTERLQETT